MIYKSEYIKECNERLNNDYDYSLIPECFMATDKIPLICPRHGLFYSIARNHKNNGSGCPKCGYEKVSQKKRINLQEFIRRVNEKHNDKYIVQEDTYTKVSNKVTVKCCSCNNMFVTTGTHLLKGYGCPICNPFPKKMTHDEFVKKLSTISPNLTVMSEYKGNKNEIYVKCNIHNYQYKTTPNRLISGTNCKLCYNERRGETTVKTLEQLLIDFRKVHGYKYTYPNLKEEYKNNKSKLTIICPIHGEFKMNANKHLQGQGCKKCSESIMERSLNLLLSENNIKFNKQVTFNWLKGIKGGSQSIDIYLPVLNITIECQGEQHFIGREYFGGNDAFHERILNDINKHQLCSSHGMKMVYIIPRKYRDKIFDARFKGIYENSLCLIYEDILSDKTVFLDTLKL